jgi:glutathione synthase/RimK-type ligase-like ATP-grasp enzyme
LLADTRALARHFGLEIVGVDYIAGPGGDHHLLEVNPPPNETVFPEIREAFLALAARWIAELPGA